MAYDYTTIYQKFTSSFLNQDPLSFTGKMMALFISKLNEIEVQIDKLKNITDIYSQSGKTLDQLGSLFNTLRQGLPDDAYRAFILVGEAARYSGGTIEELVEIGAIVSGATGQAVFRATSEVDAKVYCVITANIDNFQSPVLVGEAISKVRAAGIAVDFTPSFVVLSKSCDKYTATVYLDNTWTLNNTITLNPYTAAGIYANTSGVLDAHGKFDARLLMNPFVSFNGYQIAVGTGATGQAQETDTGLTAETLRKTATITTLGSGELQFSINVLDAEAVGSSLNEVALFNSDGLMILKYVFPSITKSLGQVWTFTFQSSQNE